MAAAQDKPLSAFYRETWTTRQGLPHNQVNAIAQSPDGYLWLGTWEGLVRYNGLEFHVFDRANTPELKDNGIRSVRAASDGAVVIGTSQLQVLCTSLLAVILQAAFNGAVDIVGGRLRDVGEHLLGGGIDAPDRLAGSGANPLAVDQQLLGAGGDPAPCQGQPFGHGWAAGLCRGE